MITGIPRSGATARENVGDWVLTSHSRRSTKRGHRMAKVQASLTLLVPSPLAARTLYSLLLQVLHFVSKAENS